MFLSERKVLIPLMSPMVPMEIRSSMFTPVDSKRRAMKTTSRRLCSISSRLASRSPSSNRARASASASRSSGGGKMSLPPM